MAINTHRGLFINNRLPFGVSSAPEIFQRTMDNLLQDIPSVLVYLDDILVAGRIPEEHYQTLAEVLARLSTKGYIQHKPRSKLLKKFILPKMSLNSKLT